MDPIFTPEHILSRLVTLCQELLYILGFDLYTVSMTSWCNLTQTHSFWSYINLGQHLSLVGQVKLRQIRLCQVKLDMLG
jgi:hypothetical protein